MQIRGKKCFVLQEEGQIRSHAQIVATQLGISMHCFAKDLSVRRQWVCFVRRHRSDFEHENVLFFKNMVVLGTF